MHADVVKVLGALKVNRAFKRLETQFQHKVTRSVTAAGAGVLKKEVKKQVPRNGKDARRRENKGTPRVQLWKAIQSIQRKKKGGSWYSVVGPGYKVAPHDHLVHDGTKAHIITGSARVGADRYVSREDYPHLSPVRHPGARKNEYMTRAVQKAGPAMARVMASRIKTKIRQFK